MIYTLGCSCIGLVFIFGHLCKESHRKDSLPFFQKMTKVQGPRSSLRSQIPDPVVSSYRFKVEGPKANSRRVWLSSPKHQNMQEMLTLRVTRSKSFPASSCLPTPAPLRMTASVSPWVCDYEFRIRRDVRKEIRLLLTKKQNNQK